MAYTAVPTKNTGDTVTAAEWNAYVKANQEAGVPDIFTTKGDIAVATAADVAARLAVGIDGQALFVDSTTATGLIWGDGGPRARYKNDADQVIGNASATIVRYDTVDYDSDTAVTTGAAWKFTVPATKDGYYLVVASCYLEASANWEVNERVDLGLYKNGNLYSYLSSLCMQAAGTYIVFVCGLSVVSLVATDYIDVRLYQNSDANVTVENDGNFNHIAIARLF